MQAWWAEEYSLKNIKNLHILTGNVHFIFIFYTKLYYYDIRWRLM